MSLRWDGSEFQICSATTQKLWNYVDYYIQKLTRLRTSELMEMSQDQES